MAEQLKQGSKLLWYRIESMLGRGGFGITYLATDTNLQTRVAIKEYLPADIAERKQDSYVLPRTGADGETYRWGLTRFIDEARMLARFKHHNIVRVHSVFEENNTAYMVMDYEQGNGFDLLMRTPQFREESKLKALFADLLEGLEVVHSHDVIHRDIKPANIYIREDGSPVLLDFGSARQQIAGKSHSMTRVLTKGYAPYEQMDDDGTKQGPWTDIYALGATLYYVVGSQLPVDAFSRFTKLVQKQADPLRPVHELPDAANYSREFLDAIAAAMQFEPRDRPQTVAEFRRLLLGEKPRTQPVLQPRNPPREDDATVLITPSSASLVSSESTSPDDPTLHVAAESPPSAPQPVMPVRPQAEDSAAEQKKSPAVWLGVASVVLALVGAGAFFALRPASVTPEPVVEVSPSEQAGIRAATEANKLEQAEAAQEQARIAEEETRAREEARRLAEEQKRIAAEQQALAEETARAEAAEQARLQAEQAALEAEQARLAAEQEAAREEQARLAEAQAQAAEAARVAEENAAKLAEQKRLADAQAREQAAREAAARQKAAAEAKARELAAKQSKPKVSTPAAEERARQDGESDIQSVSRLFNDLKLSLAQCDTARLQRVTRPTADSRELVGQLCGQYQSMDLGIADFQSNPGLGQASATVQIRRLVSQSGDTVLPGSSWSSLPLKTEKKDGYWQAVSW